MLDEKSHIRVLCLEYNFTRFAVFVNFTSSFFLEAEQDNGNIEVENKKLEKESKNEQERERTENLPKEKASMNSASQISVKGLSNLGNTCFFNAVMQVPMSVFSLCAEDLLLKQLFSAPFLLPCPTPSRCICVYSKKNQGNAYCMSGRQCSQPGCSGSSSSPVGLAQGGAKHRTRST